MFEIDPQFTITTLALITLLSQGEKEIPADFKTEKGIEVKTSLPDEVYYQDW